MVLVPIEADGHLLRGAHVNVSPTFAGATLRLPTAGSPPGPELLPRKLPQRPNMQKHVNV